MGFDFGTKLFCPSNQSRTYLQLFPVMITHPYPPIPFIHTIDTPTPVEGTMTMYNVLLSASGGTFRVTLCQIGSSDYIILHSQVMWGHTQPQLK